MPSKTDIANLALNHLGIGDIVTDIDTDRSEQGLAIRLVYDIVRDAVLRDYQWPFATKIVALAVVEENPNVDWAFSYRYPSDCLELFRIMNGVSHTVPDVIYDSRQLLNNLYVRYELGADTSGTLIYTNEADAMIEYVFRHVTTSFYPPDFTLALSFRIAAYVAPRITGGDPFKLGARAVQFYQNEVARARANAANEERPFDPPESEFLRARS